ncbi:MAG: slipin family protein, partial [Methanosarcinaceae archaeon]|nr:slipin family protein [Methanosarcinaceae archaeon]
AILAEGEYQAAERMKEAASLYEGVPTAIKLRELQTLAEISREKNLIVVTQTGQSSETADIAALSKAFTKKE